jgi:hypothetical protein
MGVTVTECLRHLLTLLPINSGACPLPPAQTVPNIHYPVTADANTIAPSQQGTSDAGRITITVRDLSSITATFRFKRTAKMQRVMESFAKQIERTMSECRFYYEGRRVQGDDTAESLEMEDEDIIEVHFEVTGGI